MRTLAVVVVLAMVAGTVASCSTPTPVSTVVPPDETSAPAPNESAVSPSSTEQGQRNAVGAADPPKSAEASGRPMDVPWQSFHWLVRNSPLVFVGTVKSATAEQDSARKLIVTRYGLSVGEIIVGDRRESVELVMLGGSLGDRSLTVSPMPVLSEGSTYIVFTDPARTTYDPVTGNERGVFRVGPDKGVYDYSGIPVIGVHDDQLLVDGAPLGSDAVATAEAVGQPEGLPNVEGDVKSLEPAKRQELRAMSVEEFAKLVREYRATQ